ncbi:Cadmium resistance transporter [Metarhizium guizhouense ARSEF 977]|uniref:Cadmium resistance transporter n=1 Tax=Metarhizium guizhouense (strain ARSEF 977) TaxID=1276136 RepID=A0A0B4GZG5_METGA|nr:Cadmium resistance transporter [Metarhizium guizhouense ARSEF 977]
MQFGKAIGTACSSFAITNIDDIFVLVTFMAEASTTKVLTPFKVTIGQYVGFTVIIAVSMIGFGISLVLPSEPIGFLGLLPILLGLWNVLGLFFPDNEEESEGSRIASMKSIFKVALVTVMNGGDNISTYIPLFSQTKGAEIAVYVVVYYILVGVWCLVAFLVMRQRHVLRVAEKYAHYVVPFLYVGLGIYIIVKSNCYPWTIRRIDAERGGHPGSIIMGVVTTGLLLMCIAAMLWARMRKKRRSTAVDEAGTVLEEVPAPSARQSTEAQQAREAAEAAGEKKSDAMPNVQRHDTQQAGTSATTWVV